VQSLTGVAYWGGLIGALAACHVYPSPRAAAVPGALQVDRTKGPDGRDGLDALPGMTVVRVLGPVALTLEPHADRVRARVRVALAGEPMADHQLSAGATVAEIDLARGAVAVRGSIAARFVPAGERSSLMGDLQVTGAGEPARFRGDLVAWRWSAPPVLVERPVWITPEIRADTRVLFDTEQSAQVTFATGAQPMLVIALSQGANKAIVDRGAAVGTARIESGLTLDLQIAEPLQRGAVYLNGTFASSNLPSIHYQGVLVTWDEGLPRHPDPAKPKD
jgi:hypothetical protein